MDGQFRFILEEPSNGSSKGPRKRARIVSSCDSCRIKKVKCLRPTSAPQCEACRIANIPCLYGDRDRYQAERGLSYAYGINGAESSDESSLKRKIPNHHQSGRPLSGNVYTSPTTTASTIATDASPPPSDRNQVHPDSSRPPTTAASTSDLKRITVPFFRYFGPTANTPGYRRVRVRTLTLPDDLSSNPSTSSPVVRTRTPLAADSPSGDRFHNPYLNKIPQHPHMSNGFQYSSNHSPLQWPLSAIPPSHEPPNEQGILADVDDLRRNLFDPVRPRYPNPQYLPHLTALFFDHLACHFPFLDRDDVVRRVEAGTLPAILANCIAALALRFTDRADLLVGPRHNSGEPYCDMAKLLVVHMLSWPSLEVLQALVLIAWSEFGSGRDSGLWMYSRMAVGMAMDLGLGFEATVQLASSADEREKVRLTWWAVLLIDRINSWGTGRPIAISDDNFDTALPSTDFMNSEDLSKAPQPSFVFGHLCRLVQLRGRMGDVLNNIVKKPSSVASVQMELSELQFQMTSFYQSLSPSLVFNIQNFRRFSNHNQAPVFLLLHVMFHSVITLLHRPSLLQSFTPDVALPLTTSVDLSRSSARSIVDMIMLADEMDRQALLANPFLDLPVLTAARAFLAERETLAKPPPNMTPLTAMLTRQWGENSLERCKDVLAKMSKFWGGVECVRRILDQQSVGDLDFDVGEGNSGDSHIAHLRDVELITQWATKAWRRHVGRDGEERHNAHAGGVNGSHSQPYAVQESTSGESPAGASVGITGFLDAMDLTAGFLEDPANSLRVSFNTAEADLSFANFAPELFSIPEGFEDFLIRAAGSMDGRGLNGNIAMQNGAESIAPAFSTLIGPWFPMGQHLSRAPSPGPGV